MPSVIFGVSTIISRYIVQQLNLSLDTQKPRLIEIGLVLPEYTTYRGKGLSQSEAVTAILDVHIGSMKQPR